MYPWSELTPYSERWRSCTKLWCTSAYCSHWGGPCIEKRTDPTRNFWRSHRCGSPTAGSGTTSGPLGPREGSLGLEDQSTSVTLQDSGPVFPLPSSQTDVGLSDDSITAFFPAGGDSSGKHQEAAGSCDHAGKLMSFSADANKLTTWVGVGNTKVGFLLLRNWILIRNFTFSEWSPQPLYWEHSYQSPVPNKVDSG